MRLRHSTSPLLYFTTKFSQKDTFMLPYGWLFINLD